MGYRQFVQALDPNKRTGVQQAYLERLEERKDLERVFLWVHYNAPEYCRCPECKAQRCYVNLISRGASANTALQEAYKTSETSSGTTDGVEVRGSDSDRGHDPSVEAADQVGSGPG